MKYILIITFLFSLNIYATENIVCTDKPVKIKVAGFLGSDPKKTMQIAQLVNTLPEHTSTFGKSFEIGKYRFVRNDKKWDIYRKSALGVFELKNIKGTFKIDSDQNIFATIREDGEINIRRDSGDEKLKKEINILFSKKEIFVQDGQQNKLLTYINCGTNMSTPQAPVENAVPVHK